MTGEVPYNKNLIADCSFEAYTDLTNEYSSLSPQRQGLTFEDFAVALDAPDVAKTIIEEADARYVIPQLMPIRYNQWLNADFYNRMFPDQYNYDNVLYYIDIPRIEVGKEVRDRLTELARDNGTLVFDYSLASPEYLERVQELLNELGISASETNTLGHQTYFAGQTRVNTKSYPLPSPQDYVTTFKEMTQDGSYDLHRIANGASLLERVSPEQAQIMLS